MSQAYTHTLLVVLLRQQQSTDTSAVHAEMALATNRLAKGNCGPPEDATILRCCVRFPLETLDLATGATSRPQAAALSTIQLTNETMGATAGNAALPTIIHRVCRVRVTQQHRRI